jgi:hypothetical protein
MCLTLFLDAIPHVISERTQFGHEQLPDLVLKVVLL